MHELKVTTPPKGRPLNRFALLIVVSLFACGGPAGTGTGGGGGSGGGGSSSATITSDVPTVSMIATSCTSTCTVAKTVVITSSTAWTSTTPGFGSLGSGFVIAPDVGPAGSTSVVISYSADCCPSPADGFIRFRSTTVGVYAEVSVIVTVN